MENEFLVQPKLDQRRKPPADPLTIALAVVRYDQQLGGLLKSYRLRAA